MAKTKLYKQTIEGVEIFQHMDPEIAEELELDEATDADVKKAAQKAATETARANDHTETVGALENRVADLEAQLGEKAAGAPANKAQTPQGNK